MDFLWKVKCAFWGGWINQHIHTQSSENQTLFLLETKHTIIRLLQRDDVKWVGKGKNATPRTLPGHGQLP